MSTVIHVNKSALSTRVRDIILASNSIKEILIRVLCV